MEREPEMAPSGRSGRSKIHLAATLIAAAAGLSLAAWGAVLIARYFEKQRESLPVSPPEPLRVETFTVEDLDLPLRVEATGFLASPATLRIPAEAPGLLLRKLKEEGDAVAGGDVVAEIDGEIHRVRLDGARARERSWKAQHAYLQRETERVRRLVSTDAVGEAELDRLSSEMLRAEAALEEAAAAIREAEILLARCRVRAPRDGVWFEDLAREGEYLHIGQSVGLLRVIDPLELTVEIPGRLRLALEVGAGVSVEILDVDESAARIERWRDDCEVVRLPAGADPASSRFPVVIRVDNPGGSLIPGLFCRAIFETPRPEPLRWIPKECVFDLYGKTSVYVLADGEDGRPRAEPRFVSLREVKDLPGGWRVVEGLRPGDVVITAPIDQISAGASVEPGSVR